MNLSNYSKDITGQKFGKLTAVSPARIGAGGSLRWNFRCDCGGQKESYVQAAQITQHCGCETKARLHARQLTHGQSKTAYYKMWSAMKDRCANPKNRQYHDYGGRGISYCPEWESFESFYSDMGEKPKGMTLERKDNSVGYSKDNCIWATRKEQQRNRRTNKMIGSVCVAEFADYLGLPDKLVRGRLERGWSEERIRATPYFPYKPRTR